MLVFEAPVNEQRTALNTAVWTLFGELFTMPLQWQVFMVAGIADIIAHLTRYWCAKLFFDYQMSSMHPPSRMLDQQREQMRYWHELAEMGKWVCWLSVAVFLAGTLALCALVPQPRAAGVVRACFFAFVWEVFVAPMLTAIVVTFVLVMARRSSLFDGLLTLQPRLINFIDVGVQTPEFLAWRIQRIVSEHVLLRQVYAPGTNNKEMTVRPSQISPKTLKQATLALEASQGQASQQQLGQRPNVRQRLRMNARNFLERFSGDSHRAAPAQNTLGYSNTVEIGPSMQN